MYRLLRYFSKSDIRYIGRIASFNSSKAFGLSVVIFDKMRVSSSFFSSPVISVNFLSRTFESRVFFVPLEVVYIIFSNIFSLISLYTISNSSKSIRANVLFLAEDIRSAWFCKVLPPLVPLAVKGDSTLLIFILDANWTNPSTSTRRSWSFKRVYALSTIVLAALTDLSNNPVTLSVNLAVLSTICKGVKLPCGKCVAWKKSLSATFCISSIFEGLTKTELLLFISLNLRLNWFPSWAISLRVLCRDCTNVRYSSVAPILPKSFWPSNFSNWCCTILILFCIISFCVSTAVTWPLFEPLNPNKLKATPFVSPFRIAVWIPRPVTWCKK